ncbi:SDR family oxidoreductase [Roseibium sediminicola]|uniref:SDR family oxidoreductase n=1 Tax=Roseibium sediminicola TaxID=2933272 RepID=A0ABT0GX83_9HYPH|nr:SDR family oxidoreductase [Roseibium sp. CAU 1639]MCK7613916.1 SDR family oxidoreductase [Roseibium sp. CAU 1639]
MKQAVVLGAYGFIGAACVRALQARGYAVRCAGRSERAARRAFPGLDWALFDFATADVGTWRKALSGADVVVNASGALQDGARDNLVAIHETAVARMSEALAGTDTRFVQISAAGVSSDASSSFFRTKARGDTLVMASRLDWIVLRPVLVLGPEAYGGTALLRASAALPLAGARIFSDAQIQTIHVEDLAEAVAECADGQRGSRFVADLTEDHGQSFLELTRTMRDWQGFPPWKITVPVPEPLVWGLGRVADMLGWLGWRSPLRTNALLPLNAGIHGDPDTWRQQGGRRIGPLAQTLDRLPATVQERSFARVYLALPLSILCLSLFWLLSGVIGVLSFNAATEVLTSAGYSAVFAGTAVLGGAVLDISLGLAVLWRRWCRSACLGMLAVSATYLASGTLLTPELWADPLGPLVKIFPAMMLALFVALLLEER